MGHLQVAKFSPDTDITQEGGPAKQKTGCVRLGTDAGGGGRQIFPYKNFQNFDVSPHPMNNEYDDGYHSHQLPNFRSWTTEESPTLQ